MVSISLAWGFEGFHLIPFCWHFLFNHIFNVILSKPYNIFIKSVMSVYKALCDLWGEVLGQQIQYLLTNMLWISAIEALCVRVNERYKEKWEYCLGLGADSAGHGVEMGCKGSLWRRRWQSRHFFSAFM